MLRVKRNFERLHWGHCARFAAFAIFALWVGGFPKLAVAQQPGQKTFRIGPGTGRNRRLDRDI
jgi:hypothetical protein